MTDEFLLSPPAQDEEENNNESQVSKYVKNKVATTYHPTKGTETYP